MHCSFSFPFSTKAHRSYLPCVDVLSLPPPVCRRDALLSPPEGVSSSRQKTKDKRRETPPSSTLCPALKISHPTPTNHRPENRKCRHFRPKTLPERDFYPSIFRVFCTLFEAFRLYLCQCTWPHKIPTFSRGPLIFAPARHQSATQTAPKPAPKLRAFSHVWRR